MDSCRSTHVAAKVVHCHVRMMMCTAVSRAAHDQVTLYIMHSWLHFIIAHSDWLTLRMSVPLYSTLFS